jgi:O-antigen ligase
VLVFNVGPAIRLVAAATLGLSFVSPVHGLLLVATLAPIGRLVAMLIGAGEFRIGEVMVLAFLVGWLLRTRPDRPGPRVTAASAGWLFAAAVVASIAGLALQLHAYPGELAAQIDSIVHGYFFSADRIGFADGVRLLEGLGLAAAAVMLLRQRPMLALTLPAALTASAAIAACSSVLLWRGIGTAAELERFGRGGYRVSSHVLDVNAAGSYFAMAMCMAAGMTLHARGLRRGVWAFASIVTGIGLWFSESRTAFASVGIVLLVAAMWYLVARQSARIRAAAIGAIFIVGLALAAVRVHQVNFGADYREQFLQTSLRMIAARPLFGFGVGQYYQTSALFLSPQLAWNYGFENAHNNFLQIGAELGLVGLALFVAWIGSGLARAARALAIEPRDARMLGLAAGITAFVATWTGNHPLLVGEVAFPFWMQFGVMVALAGSTLLNHRRSDTPAVARTSDAGWWRHPAVVPVAALLIVVLTIGTLAQPAIPPATQAVNGFYGWETTPDGVRFRWSTKFASVFVPGNATHVEIPVKVPAELRLLPRLEVDLVVGGVFQSRTAVLDSWTVLGVTMPEGSPARVRRIDLRVDRPWQPGIYIAGSADMRTVGIQVGEVSAR